MHDFVYVTRAEAKPVSDELYEIIYEVQDIVRDDFTFQFRSVGSLSRNMVSAKYSCGFSNPLVPSIIVGERYLDYFTTITEDRLWQLHAKSVFRWRNRSGLSMNAAKAA